MSSEPKESDEEAGATRRMDPELLAMSRMVRTLDDIDEPARARVVFWLAARYCPTRVFITTHNAPGTP